MTTQALIKEIESLSPEEQQEVAGFVAALRKPQIAPRRPTKRKRSFTEEPIFGMWKDRTDITDSVEYVRELRRRHFRDRTDGRRAR